MFCFFLEKPKNEKASNILKNLKFVFTHHINWHLANDVHSYSLQSPNVTHDILTSKDFFEKITSLN